MKDRQRFGGGVLGRPLIIITLAGIIWSIGTLLIQRDLTRAFSERRDTFERQHARATSAENILKLVIDLETGERGYLLTGDSVFLEPYDAADRELPVRLAELRRLVGDDADLRNDVDAITVLIARWHREAGDPEIAARRAAPGSAIPEPLRAILLERTGKTVIDQIRATYSRFVAHARFVDDSLEQRLEKIGRRAIREISMVAALIGMSLLGLGWLSSLQLRRSVARLIVASKRFARGDFAAPIASERGAIGELASSLQDMARSLDERDRHADALLAVGRVSTRGSLEDVLAAAREAVKPVVELSVISVFAIEGEQFRRLACYPAGVLPAGEVRPLAGSAVERAVALGEAIYVNDASGDTYAENRAARAIHAPGYVVMPLIEAEQSPLALGMVLADSRPAAAELKRFLRTLGEQLRSMLRNVELMAQVEARNQELERANRAKSEFLAMMSHELRTPLNSVIGFSDVLKDERFGTLSERQSRYVRNINSSGRHLLRLINDLLDMSKIEAGRFEILREKCALRTIVIEAFATLQPLADEAQVTLELATPHAPPTVLADALRLKQVLFNLLSNAIKFTPAGGRITVSFERLPDRTLLRTIVADTGPGIPPDGLSQLFQPFSQLADARKEQREGTGLGLALTKQLVELMNGRVSVESTPGQGSRFFVDLRVLPDDVNEVSTQHAPADAPLVLIVDDDASARELMRLTLDGARLRSVAVGTAEAALARARELRPAAILLDIFLPDGDGWEVLRALRADPVTARIPVVLVTISNDRQRSFSLGAVDHLIKPVAGDALLAALTRRSFLTKVQERPVRVLAIDDDPLHCELMRATLEPHGFIVRLASTGAAGVEIARTEPIDLILLDLVLPDLSGVEVAATLRSDERCREMPIILVTANQLSAGDRIRLNGSVAAILAKSETGPTQLLAEVRRVVGVGP